MTEALAPRHPAIVATFGKYSNHGLVLCLCRKKDKTICLLRIRKEITHQQPCALCLRPLLERKMLDPVSRRCWHFEWVNIGMAWPTGLACRLKNPGLDNKIINAADGFACSGQHGARIHVWTEASTAPELDGALATTLG